MPWSEQEIQDLKKMANEKKYFYTEIAKRLGKKPANVRYMARRLNLPRTTGYIRFGKWNSKHAHIREPVMRYFLKHTWEETRKRFGLTQSELKSLFTVSYRIPELKHLRKETRDHSPWSTKQLKFLLRHAGLRDRDWIAERIGRGNRTCIKERMSKLGIASRNLQGLTLSQFVEAFGRRPEFYLKTKAGPRRDSASTTFWRIVPWVWLDQEIKAGRLKTAKELRLLISARAMFQEWIFQGNALKKMKRICAGAA